ncbi:MAG: hydrogenase formation protein HypD [Candidatus Omnitrophica bacterium]|jgi:hydrogenase expression/formation protein HypD|nr:hydrogenase formation protein HypD [Candidatus Omnitrophota bacterium]
MKYVDEFRSLKLSRRLSEKIKSIMPPDEINIMEVCGTHTQNFYRFGLDKLVPENLHLISGPGCPVCVSDQQYIDIAIELSKDKINMILSFGDMLRVPGSSSTLEQERAAGAHVGMVYSAMDAVKAALDNPQKKIIFLAVGFETTAPTIALSIITAKKAKIKNLFFLPALKLIPPAIKFLLLDKRLKISAFLCPGHVSSIIGSNAYEFVPKKYGLPCCVAGFEPVDMLEGLYLLVRQIIDKESRVDNQYIRAVTGAGNLKAQKIITSVFQAADSPWRGLGVIPQSGLKIKDEFAAFDAGKVFPIRLKATGQRLKAKCRCGDVLKGLIRPDSCPLFRKSCTPQEPVGPCMVSQEGACNAYYRYR